MLDEIHVHPVDDLIQHDLDASCVCGPTVEPVQQDDGSYHWVLVHHALDDRA